MISIEDLYQKSQMSLLLFLFAINQGYGAALIRKIEMYCKEREISNIAVDTYTFQAPNFYESHGFKEVGRYKDYLKKGVDKIFYQKALTND